MQVRAVGIEQRHEETGRYAESHAQHDTNWHHIRQTEGGHGIAEEHFTDHRAERRGEDGNVGVAGELLPGHFGEEQRTQETGRHVDRIEAEEAKAADQKERDER